MEPTLLIKRKEAIILATIDAIDECGIQAISTREIAKKQGVSERIIFKHFSTKNDLFIAVLEYFAKYDNAIIQTAESKKMKPLEAIEYFFESYSRYYENYPAITAITQSYDALLHNPELSIRIKNISNLRAAFIKKQIEEAKKMGTLPSHIDCEILTDILIGTFIRLCLKWRMEHQSFSLNERTLLGIRTVLDSLKK